MADPTGYNTNNSYSNAFNTVSNAFTPLAGISSSVQIKDPGVIDAAFGNSKTVMQKLSNTDHIASLPLVNTSALKVDAGKSISDMKGIAATAQMSKEQAVKVGSNFASEVKQAQTATMEAMNQAAKSIGIDRNAAALTVLPTPATSHMSAGASMGADLALGGCASTVTMAMQAMSEIRNECKKLPPNVEAQLMDKMLTLLTPQKDAQGAVISPAVVPNDFDFEALKPEDLKELLLPPEQHPEGKIIADMIHELDEVIELHGHVIENEHDVVTADKVEAAITSQDAGALKEMDMDAGNVLLTEQSLRSIKGIHLKENVIEDLCDALQITKIDLEATGPAANEKAEPKLAVPEPLRDEFKATGMTG